MKSKQHNINLLATIILITLALGHAFTIGYGSGFNLRGRAMEAVQEAKQYNPSVLIVHYERHSTNLNDMLRLEIDSTYRTIGRGSFCYETICDRKITLQTSSGENFTAEQVRNCFMEGGSRHWIAQHDMKVIQGYDCYSSLAVESGQTWQAWYTTQLPHCYANTSIHDGLRGLILAARSSNGEWSLRATAVDLKIG